MRSCEIALQVMSFDDLVTQEEADALFNACTSFDRSLAGDQLSPVRTSTQCWCGEGSLHPSARPPVHPSTASDLRCGEGECAENPIVQAVTSRLLNISMIPYNNSEYFQVLRYEKGQFYKVHHDAAAVGFSRLFTPPQTFSGAPRPAVGALEPAGRARLHLLPLPVGGTLPLYRYRGRDRDWYRCTPE